MKDTTVKLSGHTKDRFLERFFAAEPGLEAGTRLRLTARSKTSFTSLRVHKALLAPQRRLPPSVSPAGAAPETEAQPAELPAFDPIEIDDVAGTTESSLEPEAAFDPYAFGLVPIFQREGRDGLLAKLGTVASLDHLRQMAKAQQVVLPQQLRSGPAAIEDVRTGIADAVAKRVADRRAAAG